MHIFLSPHFDDAVYSCGGHIHRLTSAGETVKIVTVMAGEPPDPLPNSPLIRELHARWEAGTNPVSTRRQEDEAAAEILGAGTRHLDIPDCVYRTHDDAALYPVGDADIFGPVHADDPARDILAELPVPYAACRPHLYVPMGIGNHVDHVLVRQWALAHQADFQITLYADYPYSTQPEATEAALESLDAELTDVLVELDKANIQAKMSAASAYRSQVSTFWVDETAMHDAIYQHLNRTGNGKPAERYWRISPVNEGVTHYVE